jgi:hypothetical protein
VPLGFITDKEIRKKLDEYGVARVKRMVEAGEFSTTWGPNIAKWLAEKDEEEKQKDNKEKRSQDALQHVDAVAGVCWRGRGCGRHCIAMVPLGWRERPEPESLTGTQWRT